MEIKNVNTNFSTIQFWALYLLSSSQEQLESVPLIKKHQAQQV